MDRIVSINRCLDHLAGRDCQFDFSSNKPFQGYSGRFDSIGDGYRHLATNVCKWHQTVCASDYFRDGFYDGGPDVDFRQVHYRWNDVFSPARLTVTE